MSVAAALLTLSPAPDDHHPPQKPLLSRLVPLARLDHQTKVDTSLPNRIKSDFLDSPMHRTPDSSDTLIRADHGFTSDQFILLARVRNQELDFLEDLFFLEIAQTDGLFAAVDVVRFHDGVLVRTGRDAELGAGIFGCEVGEQRRGQERFHAPTRAGPVAVVEVEAFTLEDEGCQAVLLVEKERRGRLAYGAAQQGKTNRKGQKAGGGCGFGFG